MARRRLLCLWLTALAPLVWVPGGFSRFVFAKLLVTALAGLLAATVTAQGRLPRPVVLTVAAAGGLLVVAALVGETPVASLVGRWPRYEGIPVLLVYAGALWTGARITGRGPLRLLHLAHALSVAALVLAAASLLEVLGRSPLGPSDLERSGSLLGNATDQGLVAMMTAAVIGSALLDRRDWLLVAGLAGSLATVAFSGSRTALVVTVVALVAVAGARDRRVLPRAGLAVLAMLAVALAVPDTRERLLTAATAGGRLTQWRLTLDLVADHPWLGLGPSRYVDAFGRYESAGFVDFTGPAALADSPHQLGLQVLVAGGLPLLACAVVLAVVVVRRARVVLAEHPEAWGLAASVGGYGVALMANPTAPGPGCLAAFLAGALLAVPPSAEGAASRRLAPLAFAVAALVLFASCVSEVFLRQGVDDAAAGRAAGARAHLGTAASWRPLDRDVAMLGAQALAGLADTGDAQAAADAEELAGQSLARTPDSYQALVARGVARIAGGDLEGARDDLDHTVRLFPERPDGYVQRAVARYGLGDVDGARTDLLRAREISPRSRVVARLLEAIG